MCLYMYVHGIPNDSLKCYKTLLWVSSVTLGLGLTASIIFIVVQAIILVDFAHAWAENW